MAKKYKIPSRLATMNLGYNHIEDTHKIKINGKIAYRRSHPIVKQLIKYGKNGMITKTTAITEYKLTPKELENFSCFEAKNPHSSCAAPMKLFYKDELVNYLFKKMK